MPDLGTAIEIAKEAAIEQLRKKIDGEIGDVVIEAVLDKLQQSFDFKGGKIIETSDFVRQLNKFTNDVLTLLQENPKVIGAISGFVKNLQDVETAIAQFQKKENNISLPDFSSAKQVVVEEIINQMLDNGLNQGFVQPLRDLIYQNFTSGLSLADAKIQIRQFIAGGKDETGKLSKYIQQTAQQAVDSYSGIINMKLLQEFDYNALLFTGSLIATSSPQCRFVVNELNRRITRQNWPEVEKIARDHGLIEGTTFDNLPLNLNHWGCRHGFYPIILK